MFLPKNSFHVNGDQCKAGHSKFTYRPFTLEGNFAFAAAIQEMLLQSHTGVIKLFPAIPTDWKNVDFKKLRTQGAFLVSATMKDGLVNNVEIFSEKGGALVIENPFPKKFTADKGYLLEHGNLVIDLNPGESIKFRIKRE